MSKNLIIYTPSSARARREHERDLKALESASEVGEYFSGEGAWLPVLSDDLKVDHIVESKTIVVKDCDAAEAVLTALWGFNLFGRTLFGATEGGGQELQEQLLSVGLAPKNLLFVYDHDTTVPLKKFTQEMGGFATINGGIPNLIEEIRLQIQMHEEEQANGEA